jgi:AdoMet-dependent heme synthase
VPSLEAAFATGPERFDFRERPLVVVWEMTQACDLACLHCRAEAQPHRHSNELTTQEACGLLDQIAELNPGVLVLSGGDPMKRADVYELIRYGCGHGVRMAMTPSVTPLMTDDAIEGLAEAGLSRIAFSLDGSCAEVHDSFRGVAGSFARTLEVIDVARRAGLTVQINTTVSRHNLGDLPAIAELLRGRDIALWSVFFLVPVGRGQADQRIAPEQYEEVFELLWSLRPQVPFEIKTTEAPHYRRFVLQKLRAARRAGRETAEFRYASLNVNDGRGFVFVSHTGEVFPSGFLPVSVGNVRSARLAQLYRETPLMRALRDADQFGGKCGVCEFRRVCGGSRARAYALERNPLGQEPDCDYQPPGWGMNLESPAPVGPAEACTCAAAGTDEV